MTENILKRFWSCHSKRSFKIIPLWPSYYMPQNPQNTIIQTEIKHYNQFRIVRIESLSWLQITTDTGKKLKVVATFNERYQQVLELIIIDSLNIGQQYSSYHHIITLPMTLIINISFNKHSISLEPIHRNLIHPSYSVMKSMCRHQNLTVSS